MLFVDHKYPLTFRFKLYNEHDGYYGLFTSKCNSIPSIISEATPVKDMCCGAQYCAVQTEQGVFTWGIDAILGRSSPDGRGWPAAPVVGLDGLSISQVTVV